MADGYNFWRQLDQMMGDMENMLRGSMPGFGAGGVGDRFLPAVRGEFRVDVCEDENDIMVVADLPGIDRENITARLLSPTQLEIAGERRSTRAETGEAGNVVRRERTYGEMRRMVTLPHEVTVEGARATFTNGVLELRLKKSMAERGERIPIE